LSKQAAEAIRVLPKTPVVKYGPRKWVRFGVRRNGTDSLHLKHTKYTRTHTHTHTNTQRHRTTVFKTSLEQSVSHTKSTTK